MLSSHVQEMNVVHKNQIRTTTNIYLTGPTSETNLGVWLPSLLKVFTCMFIIIKENHPWKYHHNQKDDYGFSEQGDNSNCQGKDLHH